MVNPTEWLPLNQGNCSTGGQAVGCKGELAAPVGIKHVGIEGRHVVDPIDRDRRPTHLNAEELGVMIERKLPVEKARPLRYDREGGQRCRKRGVIDITAVQPMSEVVGAPTGGASGVDVRVELVSPAAGVEGAREVLGQEPPIGGYGPFVKFMQGGKVDRSRPLMIASKRLLKELIPCILQQGQQFGLRAVPHFANTTVDHPRVRGARRDAKVLKRGPEPIKVRVLSILR
jgi:hypothetical protein